MANRDMGVITHLKLWKLHYDEIIGHLASELPNEAGGIVAGIENQSMSIYPIRNILNHPSLFRFDPQEQISAFLEIEDKGWDLLAFYHSHPLGPGLPSKIDIAEANYPRVSQLIFSHETAQWSCRGFIIRETKISEIDMHII
ncbi:MAG: M67 family metallopeptidase [Chloroflexota bacterium]